MCIYQQLFVGGAMSYLRYLCLLAHSGVPHILCCCFCFVCLRLVSCVPYVASFSWLFIAPWMASVFSSVYFNFHRRNNPVGFITEYHIHFPSHWRLGMCFYIYTLEMKSFTNMIIQIWKIYTLNVFVYMLVISIWM